MTDREGRTVVSMPRSRGGPCDVFESKESIRSASFYAAFSRRSLRHGALRRASGSSEVSMPRSRGGPCDRCRRAALPRRPRVSMPRSRGGPCDQLDLSRDLPDPGFYAAFSRRSLRHILRASTAPAEEFLCRVLAAVPATARSPARSDRSRQFLCRVLAAVPATISEK